jgi:hypothetical protein
MLHLLALNPLSIPVSAAHLQSVTIPLTRNKEYKYPYFLNR